MLYTYHKLSCFLQKPEYLRHNDSLCVLEAGTITGDRAQIDSDVIRWTNITDMCSSVSLLPITAIQAWFFPGVNDRGLRWESQTVKQLSMLQKKMRTARMNTSAIACLACLFPAIVQHSCQLDNNIRNTCISPLEGVYTIRHNI